LGREIECRVKHGKVAAAGRALLETDEVIFRSEKLRLKIPLRQVKSAVAAGGELVIAWGDDRATFALGDDAPRWANAITNPKGRIDKLGVKTGMRVVVVGVDDGAFTGEIEERAGEVHAKLGAGCDLVFLGVAARRDLARLAACKRSIRPAGAIWVIRPKGSPDVTEADVRTAAKEAGLVDVKVARFSETHTAEKLVVPVAARGA